MDETGNEKKLSAWKFRIPADEPVKLDEEREVYGMVAVALGHSAEEARAAVKRFGAENGLDMDWVDLCDGKPGRGKIARIDLVSGAVLAFAAV